MKEFWNRLTSSTPVFFKKLQVFGGSLVWLKAAFAVIPGIPASLTNIATQAAVIGGVIIAVSQLACGDKPASEDSKK